MQHLLNIRETTGMGQESLAAYLGLTRQALAKVERSICSLSTPNLLKISNLHACLGKIAGSDNKKQMPLPPEEREAEIERQEECNYLISYLQRKLTRLEASFKKNLDLYELLCTMHPSDENDALWIQKTKKDIVNKLGNCRIAACMHVRKRIYLLRVEADYISQFVNENHFNL